MLSAPELAIPAAGGADPGAFDFAVALQRLIDGGRVKVPSYPAVAIKLSELVRRQDYGIKEVVSLVSADPALALEVIRCSNSAFYGRGEITALQPAITRVGAQEVVRLALVSGLASSVRVVGPLARLRRRAWQDAVAGALVAQLLARGRALAADHAFLCGLLHDFGWLLGIKAVEELLQQRPRETARGAADWSALVEGSHVAFGLQLATRWQLPALLRDAIALHHSADLSQSQHAPMIELVQATDQVVRLLWSQPSISSEDLAALPGLRPEERTRLAAALPEIPAVIASFESESQGRPAISKVLLSRQPAMADAEWYRLERPIKLHAPKRACQYQLRSIGPRAWTMYGKDPVPEGLLLDVELAPDEGGLRHWARVTRCAMGDDGFHVECHPLLLAGTAQEKWLALLAAAQAGAR